MLNRQFFERDGFIAALVAAAFHRDQVRKMRATVGRIAQASLVTRTEEGSVWVRRWTVEIMRSGLEPAEYREYCRRGGLYLTSRNRSVSEAVDAMRLFLAAQAFDPAVEEGIRIRDFLQRYGQVTDLLAVARELVESLPEEHPNHFIFLGAEAAAVESLALSTEALTKHARIMETLERRARANPDRADYQRDLSVAYNKLGDLMRDAGEGEQARAYYQQSLEIAERLARQEPNRADYQTDIVVSLYRMGDRESLQRALTILHRLDRERKLTAAQRGWISMLEADLGALIS